MENQSWSLESFVDALVVELDKTRETLAVKAINKPLTYSVKDMALDLQIFPTYDGDAVRFVTARPGEQGASKVTIKLDSVTDQVVRATSKPIEKDDVSIEGLEDVDSDTKKKLRKIGVTSVKDLESIEKKNVDIKKVASGSIDYAALANLIKKSRRAKLPPNVQKVSMTMENGTPVILLEGRNLAVQQDFQPVVVVDDTLAEVKDYSDHHITIAVPGMGSAAAGVHELVMTLDPYSVVKVALKQKHAQ